MRLPSRTELSPEQEKIFLDAPLNGVVVIVGPPGTGKTVMAVYRAKLLAKQKKPYRVIMYNKVLLSFTKRVMDGMEDNISTWHKWVYKWWQQAYCSRIPTLDRWTPDFVKAIEIYLTTEPTIPKNINWGHLIIDEGQDFPKSFYVLCNLVVSKPKAGKPSLTVLADENQRLDTEKNSTIQEIIEALSQPVTYSLTVNYRNTYEISHLTEHFYVGARSGIPDKPNGRHGPKPLLRSFANTEDELKHIINYARLNEDQSIGIFVPTHEIRKRLLKIIRQIIKNFGIEIQTYASGGAAHNLDLDAHSMITLLCDASCKGLEFDAVFIPQLQLFDVAGIDREFLKMKFYVMSSRARTHLVYSYTDCDSPPPATELFPKDKEGIIEWQI